jgi:hypothetical protein
MKFTVKDFCLIFGFTRQAFFKRIKPVLPLLRHFKLGSRKRIYKIEEVPLILKYMPKNSKKINLMFTTPELSYLSKLISHIEQPA